VMKRAAPAAVVTRGAAAAGSIDRSLDQWA